MIGRGGVADKKLPLWAIVLGFIVCIAILVGLIIFVIVPKFYAINPGNLTLGK